MQSRALQATRWEHGAAFHHSTLIALYLMPFSAPTKFCVSCLEMLLSNLRLPKAHTAKTLFRKIGGPIMVIYKSLTDT
jgi:hypothetical protein